MAKALAAKQIYTVMPVIANKVTNHIWEIGCSWARAITASDTSADLDQWLKSPMGEEQYWRSKENDIPMWRDEGRWFLIPALILLLPVFRRGWLQRITA